MSAAKATKTKAKAKGSKAVKATQATYPDLTEALAMLQKRAAEVGPTRKQLIEKWSAQLAHIQTEITRLQKLEKLSQHVSKDGDLPL